MLIAKFMYPESGSRSDQLIAGVKLKVGKEYEVRSVNMGQSFTWISLVGPTGSFNSVLFDFYENGQPINIYRDPRYNPYIPKSKEEITMKKAIAGCFTMIQDPEDQSKTYAEFPDGLRLIFRDGKYIGWYNPNLTKEG